MGSGEQDEPQHPGRPGPGARDPLPRRRAAFVYRSTHARRGRHPGGGAVRGGDHPLGRPTDCRGGHPGARSGVPHPAAPSDHGDRHGRGGRRPALHALAGAVDRLTGRRVEETGPAMHPRTTSHLVLLLIAVLWAVLVVHSLEYMGRFMFHTFLISVRWLQILFIALTLYMGTMMLLSVRRRPVSPPAREARPVVSVLIPAKGEERVIEGTLRRLAGRGCLSSTTPANPGPPGRGMTCPPACTPACSGCGRPPAPSSPSPVTACWSAARRCGQPAAGTETRRRGASTPRCGPSR